MTIFYALAQLGRLKDQESIRRQMARALEEPLADGLDARRGHTYKWPSIHPRHRLGQRDSAAGYGRSASGGYGLHLCRRDC
jgi:hypothetical protein